MAGFTNAQILAAVLSEWARPAISQIAASKLQTLPAVATAENFLKSYALVGKSYSLGTDLAPFLHHGLDTLIEPVLVSWLSRVPDASLPSLAHSIVDTAAMQPKFCILDGTIEFEKDDILELKDLLNKNLPLNTAEKYNIIK